MALQELEELGRIVNDSQQMLREAKDAIKQGQQRYEIMQARHLRLEELYAKAVLLRVSKYLLEHGEGSDKIYVITGLTNLGMAIVDTDLAVDDGLRVTLDNGKTFTAKDYEWGYYPAELVRDYVKHQL